MRKPGRRYGIPFIGEFGCRFIAGNYAENRELPNMRNQSNFIPAVKGWLGGEKRTVRESDIVRL